MKVKSPNYIKLLIEKFDNKEQALISKELITTTEKVRMNSLVRDLQKYFENKNIWVYPCGNSKLTNVNVYKYFITDSKELTLYSPRRINISFKLKFFDPTCIPLWFDKEKITQEAANKYIKNWYSLQKLDKDLKAIEKGSFYFFNEKGGYSACDNSDGDCFCEDFKTEEEAKKYLDGWSLEEIEFGERDTNKDLKLKAYVISTNDDEDGAEMVFSDKPSTAKRLSTLSMNLSYIDLRAKREPSADKYSDIAVNNQLDWDIPEHREILEEEFDWHELED